MSALDRLKAALRREKHDVDDAIDDLTREGNATLDRKERELRASPEEKLRIEQQKADDIDADLDAIRKRIERNS